MGPEEIQQIFFVECEESLAAAEQGLAACRAGTQDGDTVNAIFRAVHSIKGGAGAFGFMALQGYTHVFETLLSDVRDGTVALGDDLIALMLRALDTLSDHVTAAREGGQPPEDAALLAELEAAQAANGGGAGESGPAAAVNDPGTDANAGANAGADADDSTSDDGFDFDFDSMLDDIVGELGGASADEEPAADEGWLVHIRPHAAAMRGGSEPLLMLRELAALGGRCVACDMRSLPALDMLDPGQGYLGWTFMMPAGVSEEAVNDIFDFIGDDCAIAFGPDATMPEPRIEAFVRAIPAVAADGPVIVASGPEPAVAPGEAAPVVAPVQAAAPGAVAAPATPPAAPAAAVQSIRIDLGKLDRLIDAVGELVIAQAMLAQRLEGDTAAATEELTLLETLTREIQESAMAIRAQPIGSVFSRVPRILRELAASTGKHVRLAVSGESTELDKTVIERLSEPLTHLIRNAVDHGIESAAERLAAGKDAEGTLTLSAEHRSGRIHIRVADDGKGIDRSRVLAKAVEKGLVAADAQLAPEEIDALIFAPGFSTAATVTNVSGRGVGMDVVRQNVKELGGRITIESEQGRGTIFTLTLPLTLAISDGMIVTVGDQTLVVPLAHVVESLRPVSSDIQGMGANRQMLNVRGSFIPVVPVAKMVGALESRMVPEEGVLIVVETERAGQAALLVDDICDQRQFVIKSLDTNYRSVTGVAGATILGDGRVALILDVDSLVSTALAMPEAQAA